MKLSRISVILVLRACGCRGFGPEPRRAVVLRGQERRAAHRRPERRAGKGLRPALLRRRGARRVDRGHRQGRRGGAHDERQRHDHQARREHQLQGREPAGGRGRGEQRLRPRLRQVPRGGGPHARRQVHGARPDHGLRRARDRLRDGDRGRPRGGLCLQGIDRFPQARRRPADRDQRRGVRQRPQRLLCRVQDERRRRPPSSRAASSSRSSTPPRCPRSRRPSSSRSRAMSPRLPRRQAARPCGSAAGHAGRRDRVADGRRRDLRQGGDLADDRRQQAQGAALPPDHLPGRPVQPERLVRARGQQRVVLRNGSGR